MKLRELWLREFNRMFTFLPVVHIRTQANSVKIFKDVFMGLYFGFLESDMRIVHSELERFLFLNTKIVFLSLCLL